PPNPNPRPLFMFLWWDTKKATFLRSRHRQEPARSLSGQGLQSAACLEASGFAREHGQRREQPRTVSMGH
ncbi:MAG: hypothetical protein AAGB11_16435, partial [Pseudomonadota bacterium]